MKEVEFDCCCTEMRDELTDQSAAQCNLHTGAKTNGVGTDIPFPRG